MDLKITTEAVIGFSSGKIIRKNKVSGPHPSTMAASSTSFGRVAINPLYIIAANGNSVATSTRISPVSVLATCSLFNIQYVGIMDAGTISPATMSLSEMALNRPLRRCIIKAVMEETSTRIRIDQKVRIRLFLNAWKKAPFPY